MTFLVSNVTTTHNIVSVFFLGFASVSLDLCDYYVLFV